MTKRSKFWGRFGPWVMPWRPRPPEREVMLWGGWYSLESPPPKAMYCLEGGNDTRKIEPNIHFETARFGWTKGIYLRTHVATGCDTSPCRSCSSLLGILPFLGLLWRRLITPATSGRGGTVWSGLTPWLELNINFGSLRLGRARSPLRSELNLRTW